MTMMMMRVKRPLQSLAALSSLGGTRGMVSLNGGTTHVSPRFRLRENAGVRRHQVVTNGQPVESQHQRPPDPLQLLTGDEQEEQIRRLAEWWHNKDQVLCLTGAGLSTESGIPDYRGNQGSYHRGHKPMVHDQFMKSEYQRKRYWGRGMVGWKSFDQTLPNDGHYALAALEERGLIGVDLEDSAEFYENSTIDLEWSFTSGHRRLALVTQNVDGLHRRAGSHQLIELHGRTDRVKCMHCGQHRDRKSFHSELESLNQEWLQAALEATSKDEMRPDGDAALQTDNYDHIRVPPCTHCGGFVKTDVVFFGDVSGFVLSVGAIEFSLNNRLCKKDGVYLFVLTEILTFCCPQTVPKHRVTQIRAAVEHADGLLVVGSSLAVHSVFRHVREACRRGIPVAILNVGETRAEVEGLNVMKLEAPAGPTLAGVLDQLQALREERNNNQPFASRLA